MRYAVSTNDVVSMLDLHESSFDAKVAWLKRFGDYSVPPTASPDEVEQQFAERASRQGAEVVEIKIENEEEETVEAPAEAGDVLLIMDMEHQSFPLLVVVEKIDGEREIVYAIVPAPTRAKKRKVLVTLKPDQYQRIGKIPTP